MEDVYHALLLLFLLNANLLMLTAIAAVLWRRKPRCVITWRSGMSDVIIPQESSATAYVTFMDRFNNVIQGATFDTDAESVWWLDDNAIGTLQPITNESVTLTANAAGQTNLHVTGRFQGQNVSDVALVTVVPDGSAGYHISIEWNQPVPPV